MFITIHSAGWHQMPSKDFFLVNTVSSFLGDNEMYSRWNKFKTILPIRKIAGLLSGFF